MNTKMILAILASAVAAFLAGWLLFGIAMAGYYEAHMLHYDGLMKPEEEMNLGLIFLGNLLFAAMVTWVCSRTGATSLMKGMTTGALLGALIYSSVDLMFMAMMNLFSGSTVVIVDIVVNTVWAALVGAVAGLVLGSGKQAG